MHIDLTELKNTLPPDVLNTILARALRQIEVDALGYTQAISEMNFAHAAHLIHSVRGLALFLGAQGQELDAIQALERELARRADGAALAGEEAAALDQRFRAFRVAFESVLRQLGHDPQRSSADS